MSNTDTSLADQLATLSEPQLLQWFKINLSSEQVSEVWQALLNTSMEEAMPNRHLSHAITYLYRQAKNKSRLVKLYQELSKQCKDRELVLLDNSPYARAK